MTRIKAGLVTIALLMVVGLSVEAQTLKDQWQHGLAGAKLTALSGSVHSSNSSLSVLEFCSDSRYRYYKEGSWSVPGQAGGASNSTITGQWSIKQAGYLTFIDYLTDRGESGSFAIYLQGNGKVNIGGLAYAAQAGAANC